MLTQQELIASIENSHKVGIELIKKKNSDYATTVDALSNFKVVEALGIIDYKRGVLVRISDKFARIINLLEKEASVSDESIDDTLVDASNYLLILKAGIENDRKEKQNVS